MTIFVNPNAWSGFGGTPPFWWEALDTDDRWWVYNDTGSGSGGNNTLITWDQVTPFAAGLYTLEFEIAQVRPSGQFVFQYRINGGSAVNVPLGNTLGLQQQSFTIPPGMTAFEWAITTDNLAKMYNGIIAITDYIPPPTGHRIVQWTRARTINPRVERYKIYRGTGAGALSLLATIEVNFELATDYEWKHPARFIDTTADASTTYRYRVDAITADGRTLPGNIITSAP